jgi:hypothetical protein
VEGKKKELERREQAQKGYLDGGGGTQVPRREYLDPVYLPYRTCAFFAGILGLL